MYLFIHAAERENAFLMLVWERTTMRSKEVLKNNPGKQSKELLTFLTFGKRIVFMKRITSHRSAGHTPDILRAIDVLLATFRAEPKDLDGICVLSGPGQFSFLRIAVATANTFGWALGIPVVPMYGDAFPTEKEFVLKGMIKLSRTKRFKAVMPEYGKEPNITISKKKV